MPMFEVTWIKLYKKLEFISDIDALKAKKDVTKQKNQDI